MTIKSLKSVLKFWQEIVFVVLIGFGLMALAKAVVLGYIMDGWDIFLVCFFVPLLICLIGQFFLEKWGFGKCFICTFENKYPL